MRITEKVAAIVASLAIILVLPVVAEEKHDHGADHGHADAKPHFDKPAFSNVKEAWAAIVQKISEAEKNLGEKKWEPVHRASEQIEGAVHTLEDKSDMVAADAKPKLASALKQLDKAVDDLHHAAEESDQATAELILKKIKGLVPLVEGLYPAGVLK